MWKVLIAEDSLENRTSLLDGLKEVADCALASTGKEALELYKQARKTKAPFDFVLLDVTMPELDGFSVLKAIRVEEEKDKKQKKESLIIMTTAYQDSLMEKYNMGWDDFITKPIDAKRLVDHMKALFLTRA